MQTHGNEHQSVAHALASISQDLGHTAVALETSIAVFNADAGLSESSVVLFLCRSQFLPGFPLLFALAFNGGCQVPGKLNIKVRQGSNQCDSLNSLGDLIKSRSRSGGHFRINFHLLGLFKVSQWFTLILNHA